MRKSGLPPRRTPIARSPVRRRNAKRHTANALRAYGGPDRCAWVASQPCTVRGCPRQPSQNAHTASGGVSRKADASTVIPLCAVHHHELHTVGARSFERLHALSLDTEAQRIARVWEELTAA